MNDMRRTFLQWAGGLAALAATGLLRPVQAWAAGWNKTGFESKAANDVLKSLGATNPVESKDIAITAPDIAENGAVVPIEIQSNIPGTTSISVLIEKNPFPYAATFDVSQGALPFVALRVKIGESTDVRAVIAAADGKFYTAQKEVKVTIGGCGG